MAFKELAEREGLAACLDFPGQAAFSTGRGEEPAAMACFYTYGTKQAMAAAAVNMEIRADVLV